MVRRLFRFGLRVAVLAALAFVARKVWESRQRSDTTGEGWAGSDKNWEPPPAASPRTPPHAVAEPAAAPPAPAAAEPAAAEPAAAEPAAAPPAHAPPPPATAPAASAEPSRAASSAPLSAAAPASSPAASVAPKVAKAAGGTGKPAKAPVTKPDTSSRVWVEPVGSTCPPDHPVKVKLASRLFRVPGMFAYERSRPDRCYPDEQAAMAEGFTRAQR